MFRECNYVFDTWALGLQNKTLFHSSYKTLAAHIIDWPRADDTPGPSKYHETRVWSVPPVPTSGEHDVRALYKCNNWLLVLK